MKKVTFVICCLVLSACGSPRAKNVQVGNAEVRRVQTNIPFAGGGKETLFIISPFKNRSLAERIRLAQAELAANGNCELTTTNERVIQAMTNRNGGNKSAQLLIAPVKC